MGSDQASFIKKPNLHKTCSFTHTFCFIDDLCAINDNDLFKKHFKEIYREGLELKGESINSTKASILDIDPTITHRIFETNSSLPVN